jgi:hypothetical protein
MGDAYLSIAINSTLTMGIDSEVRARNDEPRGLILRQLISSSDFVKGWNGSLG